MSNPFADDDFEDDEKLDKNKLDDITNDNNSESNIHESSMSAINGAADPSSSADVAYVPVVEAISVNPFGDDNDENEVRLGKNTSLSANPFGADDNETIAPPLPPKNISNTTIPPKRMNENQAMSVAARRSSNSQSDVSRIPPQLPPKRTNENQGMSVAARRSSGGPLTFGIPNDTREKLPEVPTSGLQRDPTSGLVTNPFDNPDQDKTRRVSLTFEKVNRSLLPLSADLRKILINGWELNASIEALRLHHTAQAAVKHLYEKGKSSPNSNSLANLWKPPLLVRVGSWLPNFDDQSTGYIVTVTIGAAVNISWQVVLRYSKFLEFYNEVYRETARLKVDIEMTQNKFPQDRLSNWFKGMTDDVRNKRKSQLDSWLRELFATPAIMTIPEVFAFLCYRFEVTDDHLRAVSDTQLIERATFNVQDSLINPNRYKKA
jgi:hypothetical protein